MSSGPIAILDPIDVALLMRLLLSLVSPIPAHKVSEKLTDV